jgi:myo-inositol-1-phosphate synthase
MIRSDHSTNTSLLLLIAGAKGAVASTLAVALAAMQSDEASVLPNLTTGNMFDSLGPLSSTRLAGWDTSDHSLTESIKMQGVLPDSVWQPHAEFLDRIPVCQAGCRDGIPKPG